MVERLAGKAGMRVLKNDLCMPVNLNLIGSFKISTSSAGEHEIYISGLYRTLTTTLGFINSSIQLINDGYNMTKMISIIAWNVSTDV